MKSLKMRSGKEIPFEDLTDAQLQKALVNAQRKQLRHHNAMGVLDDIIDDIIDEAGKRELELKELDDEFTKNTSTVKAIGD